MLGLFFDQCICGNNELCCLNLSSFLSNAVPKTLSYYPGY